MSNTWLKIISFQQRKEEVNYQETKISLALDFPQKTKVKSALRENNIEPRILHTNQAILI